MAYRTQLFIFPALELVLFFSGSRNCHMNLASTRSLGKVLLLSVFGLWVGAQS